MAEPPEPADSAQELAAATTAGRDEPPRFARYAIEAELGRGGMAVVYRARDHVTGKVVAIKQLLASGAASARELTALFAREFHLLAQLSHPRVIQVYDYGVNERGNYYTMELLDGGDLRELSPLPWRRACALGYDVCSSLALLHSRRFIHRDVSPRNVRCTRDGSAKLIDFGAAVPMGFSAQIVGTPAFVSPEVVNRQQLDGRADLFSFGATLYFALTGTLAYRARAFSELSQAWSERPPAPSHLVAGIPAALDDLVMSLLSPDAAARPRSAFEVMQRLAALADLPQDEAVDVSRAYLCAPLLVGREAIVSELRTELARAARGRGGSVLIESAAGGGRSRMLDTCALEAKLLGFSVLRAHADPAGRTFGVAQRLLEQLPELSPDLRESIRGAQPETAPLFEPDSQAFAELCAPGVDRPVVQEALLRCFVAASQRLPLLIAVDDVHDVDDASVAFLAALAHAAGSLRLALIFAAQSGAPERAARALEVLTGYCRCISLPPLTAEETLSLLGSLFGDVPNLALLADRIQPVACGSPGACMALAEWLVERGVLRYDGGSWSLPVNLRAEDLPAPTSAWLERLEALSPLALRLAQSQAFAAREALAREDYALLLHDVPTDAVDRALTELIARRVLISDGHLYRFAQRDFSAVLRESCAAVERAERHRALARMYESAGASEWPVLYHLLQAGDGDEALRRLLSSLLREREAKSENALIEKSGLPWQTIVAIYLQCLELAERRPASPLELGLLRRTVLSLSLFSDDTAYRRAAPALLEQLTRDSGLADWRTLSALEPSERLKQALTTAFERYNQTAPDTRGFRPDEAIRSLATFAAISIAVGGRSLDDTLLSTALPLLEPFAPLNPALDAIWQSVLGTHDSRSDRKLSARARFEQGYEVMAKLSDRELRNAEKVRYACAFGVGAIEVALGIAAAERWADVLDGAPLLRVNAMYLRKVLALQQGDLDAAEHFRKRAELLAIQSDTPQLFTVMLHTELEAHVLAGDLRGVRQIAARMASLAETSPGWVSFSRLARGRFLHLRGNLEEARIEYESILQQLDPHCADNAGGVLAWSGICVAYVDVLLELGRADRARAWGAEALATMERLGVEHCVALERLIALAEARTHACEAAVERLERVIETQRALGVSGMQLGASYEARLRVAIEAQDKGAIQEYAQLVAQEYRHGYGSALGARCQRLSEAMQRIGLAEAGAFPEVPGVTRVASSALTAGFEPLTRPLETATSPQERARRALALLAEAFGCSAAQLYLCGRGGLQLAAANEAPASDELARAAEAHLTRELAEDATALITSPQPMAALTPERAAGYRFHVLRNSEQICVGVIALKLQGDAVARVAARGLVEAIADCLARDA